MADPTATIVGEDASVSMLRSRITRLAAFDTVDNPHVPTLLLQGETGTGKGLVARVVHQAGPRAKGPFIDVNCAAIPETMLEAELFGFEAGSFTDAKRAKPGLFEAASGGTLFLDEVDALTVPLQSKLLKAIEEKSIRRLGSVESRRVDAKLVAATQKDLGRLVTEERFRADLYHRLAVVVLDVPPLRDRNDDIAVLAEHFLGLYARAHGTEPKRLGPGAREWLRRYEWPGNVRELSHLMERLTLLSVESELDRGTLEHYCIPSGRTSRDQEVRSADAPSRKAVQDEPRGDEAPRIREALRRSGGNVVAAAKLLGIGRNALRYRMRRYGIQRPDLNESFGDEPAAAVEPDPPPPVSSAAPIASKPPSWEQRLVAVLAIDLIFPESKALEPWTLTDRWLRSIEEKVRGFGGNFLRRSPSRLIAVFGVPRALEQSPERSLQSALALRGLAGGSERDAAPELRIGLHLGQVRVDLNAADPLASMLATGDTLAVPERLLGHAGAGEILVSETVARRLRGAYEMAGRELQFGPQPSDRKTVYSVGRSTSRRALADEPVVRVHSRFVGRERELETLNEAFETAAGGEGQVVFIVGEAGMGKSRLVYELHGRLADRPIVWIEGRCASYGASTTFLPILDGLRRHCGIDDRDGETEAVGKVERVVRDLGTDLDWTIPFLCRILSLGSEDDATSALDSASRRSESFRALRAILFRIAERCPLVLAVEDLHWIDAASEEFLRFVAEAIPAVPALLLCSYRPGYAQPFGDRSYHVRVTLRALSDSEMEDMTGSLLGGAHVPKNVQTLIGRKAEGNPFFVEEVTKSLQEEGVLRSESGSVKLTRRLREIAVPDTIQEVLFARLDRLADEARRAIQVASVIGREFALRLLERITDAGKEVRTTVDELRALELIYEKSMHPELAYMFKHALTHDVAYESVPRDRRLLLHRTIGLAIEELYADRLAEHYETLAHHFGRGEDWSRAFAYHAKAAEKAAATYANRAVVDHAHEALRIADRLGDQVSADQKRAIEQLLALAHFYLSEYGLSGEAYERAAHLSEDPATRSVTFAFSAFSHFWGHRYELAQRMVDRALELANREEIKAGRAMAHSVCANVAAVVEGDVDRFERSCVEALELCSTTSDGVVEALIRFDLAMVAEWTGQYRRAIDFAEQAIERGRALRLAHLVIWPAWFLGKAACCLGDYGRAIERLGEAHDTCDRILDRAWKGRLLNTLGWCYAEIEHHELARQYNERASALGHEIGDPEIIANSEINIAGNLLALGQAERAAERLQPVQAGLAHPGDPWMRWRYSLHALQMRGELAIDAQEPERALSIADEELAGARRHRVVKVQARALLLRGRALLAIDRRPEAEAALMEALEVAERIGCVRIVCGALERLAELARRAGDPARACGHLERRRRLIETAARSLPSGDLSLRLLATANGEGP